MFLSKSQALLLLVVSGTGARAETWTVTEYLVSTQLASDESTQAYTLKPDATPSKIPTQTSTRHVERTAAIEVVQYALSPDEVDVNDLIMPSTTSTLYEQVVEFTAAASCPSVFTITETMTFGVPEAAKTQIPKPLSTSASTAASGEKVTVQYYLSKDAVPLREDIINSHYASRWAKLCYGTPKIGTTEDLERELRAASQQQNKIQPWIIALVVALPALFLLGLLENFWWFRQMMVGKATLRLGTFSWMLLCIPTMIMTRRCPGRPDEEQPHLLQMWRSLTWKEKGWLWVRWGFRHAYPEFILGPDPRKQKEETHSFTSREDLPPPYPEGEPARYEIGIAL